MTEAAGVVAAGQQFRMSTLRLASMRLQYSTLDHLPRSVFRDEIALARECERESPGYLVAAVQA